MKIFLSGTHNIRFTNFETKRDAQEEPSLYVCYQIYNWNMIFNFKFWQSTIQNILNFKNYPRL